jgi:hypothetical protein
MQRIAVAVVAMVAVVLVTGCGGESNPRPTATAPATQAATITAAASITPTPTAMTPAHHPLSRRTGDRTVDAVLDALTNGGAGALAALAGGHVLPCTDSRDGPGPVCPPGVTPGTPVEAFFASQCEGGWVAVDVDAAPSWQRFVDVSEGLYAIARLAPRPQDGEGGRPGADYVLVFTGVSQRPGVGSMLAIRDGRIIAVDNGCTPTAAQLAANPPYGAVAETLLPPP